MTHEVSLALIAALGAFAVLYSLPAFIALTLSTGEVEVWFVLCAGCAFLGYILFHLATRFL